MSLKQSLDRSMVDERGAVLVVVALGIVMLLGAVSLAVDIGMLMSARTESQRVADLSALAGAGSLALFPTNEQLAREEAIHFAALNEIRGQTAVVLDEDVDVMLEERKVRVRVHNTAARNNPIPTIFARVLGFDEVDVVTIAVAEAWRAGSVTCQSLLPIYLADGWINFGSLEWDPSEGDYYLPPGEEGSNAYTTLNVGDLIMLKPSQGGTSPGSGQSGGGGGSDDPEGSRFEPSAYFLWLPDGLNGTEEIRRMVRGEGDCGGEAGYSIGDWLTREAGNKQAVEQAFEDIIAAASDQHYDETCKCILDGNGGEVTGGVRYRAVPLMDPNTHVVQGSGPHFQVSNFAGVFVEKVDPGPPGQRNVYARFMGFTGSDGVGSAHDPDALVSWIRLIQ